MLSLMKQSNWLAFNDIKEFVCDGFVGWVVGFSIPGIAQPWWDNDGAPGNQVPWKSLTSSEIFVSMIVLQ